MLGRIRARVAAVGSPVRGMGWKGVGRAWTGEKSLRMSAPVRDELAEDQFEVLPLDMALSNEISFEESSSEEGLVTAGALMEQLSSAFPEFEVSMNDGASTFVLSRHVDSFSVHVEMEACSQDLWELGEDDMGQAEDGEEGESVQALSGQVRIEKDGGSDSIVCAIAVPIEPGAGVELSQVWVVPRGTDPRSIEDKSPYTPPVFSELDIGLQASFHRFLIDLGVGDEFADAVRAVADQKEHFEYLRWLKKVHAAIS